ncbi:beta-ketoacyl-ACP synthase II [Syntrophomonas wolfei]|uniref:3-oxoacyl-[acyl-carrier-protein] synthase 2 n=1 Tax=Syntrophomonas wolfei subsp. wolfei (strain DSM 2245B / Goettingen) TaxID=335541 RepID=Q0AVV8_SYNWW|nr:beta-ketoacyl-ACP synthase II [Syntrophomonas wolfei]ABI69146.1 3-oxoacyl-[acyl-carrier-protein] synthase II [Syntrophomonas wolfei subsp. wolfei str. Goettingen G311]
MTARRVVITGLGMISPIGNNKKDFWTSLIEGRGGIGHIDRFDASDFPTRIAAQVKDFNVQDYIPRKDARRMDLFVQYACSAARIAVEDAGLQLTAGEAPRVGVWIGSGIGGIQTFEEQHAKMLQKGVNGLSPFFIPMMISNMAAGQVAIMLGARGPNGCTVTACASGSNSLGEALQLIRLGKADVMIAGGSEASITPVAVGGFCAMKALSTANEDPARACRPFDIKRDGFIMGEGAAILVLEEMEHALRRGARIYAELVGYGASADAVHMVQPDIEGRGAALAFSMALADAGIKPEEVDYINAHGTGTELNDQVETRAIKSVFAEHSYQMMVSSTKPYTGHMLGAAGAIELIASVLSLVNNTVPPTLNLEEPDPICDLDYVPGKARQKELKVVLSDSLGFGGHNAALVIRKI